MSNQWSCDSLEMIANGEPSKSKYTVNTIFTEDNIPWIAMGSTSILFMCTLCLFCGYCCYVKKHTKRAKDMAKSVTQSKKKRFKHEIVQSDSQVNNPKPPIHMRKLPINPPKIIIRNGRAMLPNNKRSPNLYHKKSGSSPMLPPQKPPNIYVANNATPSPEPQNKYRYDNNDLDIKEDNPWPTPSAKSSNKTPKPRIVLYKSINMTRKDNKPPVPPIFSNALNPPSSKQSSNLCSPNMYSPNTALEHKRTELGDDPTSKGSSTINIVSNVLSPNTSINNKYNGALSPPMSTSKNAATPSYHNFNKNNHVNISHDSDFNNEYNSNMDFDNEYDDNTNIKNTNINSPMSTQQGSVYKTKLDSLVKSPRKSVSKYGEASPAVSISSYKKNEGVRSIVSPKSFNMDIHKYANNPILEYDENNFDDDNDIEIITK